VYLSSSGVAAAATDSHWDNTNGRLGIGTASPGYKLETSGGAIAVTGTNNYLYYAVTNSTASGAYMMFDAQTAGGSGRKYQIGTTGTGNNPGTGCFELYDATGSATRLVVNSSGSVGIGTTSPGYTLDVNGGIGCTYAIGTSYLQAPIIYAINNTNGGGAAFVNQNLNAGSSAYAYSAWQTDTGTTYIFKNSSTRSTDGGVKTCTFRNDDGALRLCGAGDSPNIYLDNAGQAVVIGKNGTSYVSPCCLHLAKNNGVTTQLILECTGYATAAISLSQSTFTMGAENKDITFRTGCTYNGDYTSTGTERMRIRQDGRVGIGTASPSYPLQVQATVATGSTAARYFNNPTALTSTAGSVFNVSILGIGDIGTNGSIVAFSDRRAKILESDPTESYLNLVNKVDVRQYSWIDKISKDSSKKIGFFAQEVEKVLPDAVGTTTGVVPTIYHEADAFTESTITVTNHGLTTERKLEVVDPENGKTTIDIVRVIDADNLEVKFEKVPKDKLFVVGPEVDDSRMVNHDYLMAVGFGGLKELHALVKTQQTTIEILTERFDSLESRLAAAGI
jgi:hypothetical protein